MIKLHLFNNKEGFHATFEDAFVALHTAVKAEKNISMQLLESWT